MFVLQTHLWIRGVQYTSWKIKPFCTHGFDNKLRSLCKCQNIGQSQRLTRIWLVIDPFFQRHKWFITTTPFSISRERFYTKWLVDNSYFIEVCTYKISPTLWNCIAVLYIFELLIYNNIVIDNYRFKDNEPEQLVRYNTMKNRQQLDLERWSLSDFWIERIDETPQFSSAEKRFQGFVLLRLAPSHLLVLLPHLRRINCHHDHQPSSSSSSPSSAPWAPPSWPQVCVSPLPSDRSPQSIPPGDFNLIKLMILMQLIAQPYHLCYC